MSYSDQSQESSHRLLEQTDDDEGESEKPRKLRVRERRRILCFGALITFVAMTFLIAGFVGGVYLKPDGMQEQMVMPPACKDPTLRREWRSLESTEQKDYIEAVKCLKTLPSQLDVNQTLYDDFPWVHLRFGEYSHDAAPFLAWHRYFIHTYEQNLRERCGYRGHLAYWDWTLDWENIATSPVFDMETGFGGNGNKSMGDPVFSAWCVTEGPFANLEVLYFEHIYKPHCLLRGFDDNIAKFRVEYKPEALSKLLLSADYNALNLGLENGPHINIPKSINGDFSLHTAPSDPVFFLHHTQLDRMWWRWQQMDFQKRSIQYLGKAETNSTEVASVEDTMPMGGLAPDIKVADILSTESDLLCYRY